MADERPQYQHGVGTIDNTQFHWGSGAPGKYWSIPYGDYPVTPNAPTGAWAHQAGAIPINNNVIPDSLLGRNRIGIMIHSGSGDSLDQLYTQGCFKVAPQDWPTVRSEILADAQKGPLYLHVQPGGVASFTNTKTLDQTSIPTAASPAPPVASTNQGAPASSQASTSAQPTRPSFYDALANVESNNRNIPSTVDKDYAGMPGSKSQGFWQADVPTWQQFAPKAGVDISQYPTPMSAPREVQQQGISAIPFGRFGDRTQRMMSQQFGGPIDTTKTVGQLAAQYGTNINSTPANVTAADTTAPAAPTAGAPAAPAAPAAAPAAGAAPAPAGGVQGVLGALTSDKATAAFSSLDKALGGKGLGKDAQQQQQQGQQGPAQIQASPIIPGPGAHIPQPETMGQTLNSMPELVNAQAQQGQPGQQGGMSAAQAMAMLQQLAAQQAPQSQIQLPSGMSYPGMYGYPGGGLV